jgi:siroheme synthase
VRRLHGINPRVVFIDGREASWAWTEADRAEVVLQMQTQTLANLHRWLTRASKKVTVP